MYQIISNKNEDKLLNRPCPVFHDTITEKGEKRKFPFPKIGKIGIQNSRWQLLQLWAIVNQNWTLLPIFTECFVMLDFRIHQISQPCLLKCVASDYYKRNLTRLCYFVCVQYSWNLENSPMFASYFVYAGCHKLANTYGFSLDEVVTIPSFFIIDGNAEGKTSESIGTGQYILRTF